MTSANEKTWVLLWVELQTQTQWRIKMFIYSFNLEDLRQNFPKVDEAQLECIIDILKGNVEPDDIEETEKWVRQCYYKPRIEELTMHAIDTLLDGFGVESLKVESAYVDSFWKDNIASYSNQGDAYCTTLLLNHETKELLLTNWGDFLLEYELEHMEEKEDDED